MTAFGPSKGDETVRTCRVLLIDLKLFNYHHFYTDELTPIEIRIRKLVEDFFANKIAAHEFKFELRRIHLSRHLRRSYSPVVKNTAFTLFTQPVFFLMLGTEIFPS
jgi:hypothetical protein